MQNNNSSEISKIITPEEYIQERLQDQINWYSNKSTYYKHRHMFVEMFVIVASASIPILTLLHYVLPDGIQVPILSLINPIFILSDLTIALIGGLTAIFTSYSKLSKLQENWLNYREVSETLKHEKYLYLSKSGPYSYSGQDDKTIFKLLVERAENIISHENLNWTQVNRSRV